MPSQQIDMSVPTQEVESGSVVGIDMLIKKEHGAVVWSALGTDGKPVVIKLYRHRGLWNTLRGRVVQYRVEREFHRLSHLNAWGVRCTVPCDWTHGYSSANGYFEVLVTELVDKSIDLATFLKQGATCGDFGPLFSVVHDMHETGFRHHALYARNILYTAEGPNPSFWICDVPRSRLFPHSLVGSRMGRLDIVDLAASLIAAGLPREELALESYGFRAQELAQVNRMLDRYSKARPYRIARDIESRVRHAFAALKAFLSGHARTLSPG
jgi:hypothetical protein